MYKGASTCKLILIQVISSYGPNVQPTVHIYFVFASTN